MRRPESSRPCRHLLQTAEELPDSNPRHPPVGTTFQVDSEWDLITIPLTGVDLSYVLGGFGWVTNNVQNPDGVVFYLDKIRYDKARLDDPRFIVSYVTLPINADFDLILRNVAFTYDNAVAALAFMARGEEDDWRRAELLCDALAYAVDHDRHYTDGGMRNAYQAGDLVSWPGWTPHGIPDTVRMPGFFLDGQWSEDRFQVSRYTGNSAWTIMALLTFYETDPKPEYLDAALAIAGWIHDRWSDEGFGGFLGGFTGWELPSGEYPDDPEEVSWASTEHNIDLVVAFRMLHRATGDPQWLDHAQHAWAFVQQMWLHEHGLDCNHWNLDCGDDCGFYIVGTKSPEELNLDVLALDPQSWSPLALPEVLALHPSLPEDTECLLGATCEYDSGETFEGFDFGYRLEPEVEGPDGVWFEGTGHMVLVYLVAGQPDPAAFYLDELERAQMLADNSNGMGILAACPEFITTGFEDDQGNPTLYYARLHIGATGWFILAESHENPFRIPGDVDGDWDVDTADLLTLLGAWGPCPGCPEDIDWDGDVGTADLMILLGNWG